MKIEVNGNSYEVNEIRTDSRKVEKGDLFIAYKGVKVDGHDYINQAVEKGATLIVYEDGEAPKNVKSEKVKSSRETWAILSAKQHKNPQDGLKFIGITGTDGKTTTSNFVYEILKSAGKKVGIISTVSAKYGSKDVATGLHTTSPDPDVLFKLLSDMVGDGIEYVVLEVTSHALVQKRFFGIYFETCGVTNVTPEHLDAHGSYEQLIKDKALLFDVSDNIVLNKVGIGIPEISVYANKEIIHSYPDTDLIESLGKTFENKFPGEYNLQNAALALEIGKIAGASHEIAVSALVNATPPKGRFQRIENALGINVIVDFAHTENAMRKVLSAVSKIKKTEEKLITVFGCAGERDFYKRPNMGKTASEFSDIVVLTAEDPRSEDVNEIIKQIKSGNPDYKFISEPDRHEAIFTAIKMAAKGDWVLILGKGHEESININGVEIPWSDIKESRISLSVLGGFKVCLDSRLVKQGDYFVPVAGETFDGHDYIENALKNGAAGVIEESDLYEIALAKLSKIRPKVIAITGSVGKTTMRNFVSTILSEKYRVCVGSLNTKLGLATNIVNSLKFDDEIFVAEAGMDRKGELLETGKFLNPNIAVITHISQSHMGKLGTLEAIRDAKAELLQTVIKGGTVFLNWDCETIHDVTKFIPAGVDLIKYSFNNKDNFNLVGLDLKFIGDHNYLNAFGAISICKKLGLSDAEIISGLEKIKPEKGRLNILSGINGSVIIDDTYNASPVSMKSGLKASNDYFQKSKLTGRKIAVIGGMLELGSYENEGHESCGVEIVNQGYDLVVLIGDLAKKYFPKPSKNIKIFESENSVEAIGLVKSKIKPQSSDIIFIKASQGIRLEKTVEGLLENPGLSSSLLVRQDERWKTL